MRGWLLSSSPGTEPGDTTPWYASFWEFCAGYCHERFADRWHLSPEQSLLLHGESTVIPTQVIIHTPEGANNTVNLPFGCSLYDLRQPDMPPERDLVLWHDLPVYSPAAALIKVPAAVFRRHPLEAQVVLVALDNPSDLVARLLDGGHSAVAGRLAGAMHRVGRADVAVDIHKAMKSAGYDVRQSDPFDEQHALGRLEPHTTPIVGRLNAMWESLRGEVLKVFPEPPEKRLDAESYLRVVDETYASDAYHSLSIEGYIVSPDLVERVRAGDWDPDSSDADRKNRDALAARGYWEAFQLVKSAVARIIGGENPGTVVRATHRDWHRALFQPCVRAGLVPPSALAGYRNDLVFIRGSRHVPPRWNIVPDAMSALFDLLEEETEPAVRAVLGHWLVGYIHPYADGNGRLARYAMNAMLASGGYPWMVIRVKDRDTYLRALEAASADLDIGPFAGFLAERVAWSA